MTRRGGLVDRARSNRAGGDTGGMIYLSMPLDATRFDQAKFYRIAAFSSRENA